MTMPTTYAIIGLHTSPDDITQHQSKDGVVDVLLEWLDDDFPCAVIELTFEGWKVSETRDITNECIELAATRRLAECNDQDDADYHGVADWVRDTDAFGNLPLGKYSSADALADAYHDARAE
jgi:hypothetical protein